MSDWSRGLSLWPSAFLWHSVRLRQRISISPAASAPKSITESGPSLPGFRPNYRDVEEARRILADYLPYEVVDMVLTEAEYFPCLSMTRTTRLSVPTSSRGQAPKSDGKWLYMLSDPIPEVYHGGRLIPTKVHFVRFSTRSCDQGWGGTPGDEGTYRSSWTWFEASIFRPKKPTEPLPEWFADVGSAPIDMRGIPKHGWRELKCPEGQSSTKRWIVQRNASASSQIRHHEVKWSRDSGVGVGQSGEYNRETGSGYGFGFTRELKAGDRIALVARARYPGWVNNVDSAQIEVAYQV